jgi:hypothetical protein
MKEQYMPSPEEEIKAENLMTDEQKQLSDKRETDINRKESDEKYDLRQSIDSTAHAIQHNIFSDGSFRRHSVEDLKLIKEKLGEVFDLISPGMRG